MQMPDLGSDSEGEEEEDGAAPMAANTKTCKRGPEVRTAFAKAWKAAGVVGCSLWGRPLRASRCFRPSAQGQGRAEAGGKRPTPAAATGAGAPGAAASASGGDALVIDEVMKGGTPCVGCQAT